ncbi:MAG: hypothetical protein KC445_15215 [Anaerolineales bacterium]|nr:hypothetical protein [Anaerolineales bacterium]
MSENQETNGAFFVTITASDTKIEILAHPDLPLGAFLFEVLLFSLTIILFAIFSSRILGAPMYCCSAFLLLSGVLSVPIFLIWNYWARDSVELTENSFELRRFFPMNRSRQQYQKDEVKNCHVIQPEEKLSAFEGVWGLRLITLRRQGMIGFETPQGMMVRFGWGLSNSEAEEIVAIITNWLAESAV